MYQARFTQAGFLGELRVSHASGEVLLSGLRAPEGWVQARVFGQWALAIVGIAALLAGYTEGLLVLLAAFVFSLVAYVALWRVAVPAEVRIASAPETEASVGWVFRWVDILWLGNLLAFMLMFTRSTTGERTVSFLGPAAGRRAGTARYVVTAADPAHAEALAKMLLGT